MINRRYFLSATAAGITGAFLLSSRSLAAPSPDQVFHDPDAPVLGNPEGDVTVVEFFDYQCPYCKKSHPDVKSVVEEDGNVRFIMKDWPIFGGASVFAAQAVLGANEIGKYREAMEALMATKGSLAEADVERLLTKAGLDFGEIAGAVRRSNDKISALLTRNYEQAVAFQFAGTPAFVIGKTTFSGVLDKDQLREVIRQARAA